MTYALTKLTFPNICSTNPSQIIFLSNFNDWYMIGLDYLHVINHHKFFGYIVTFRVYLRQPLLDSTISPSSIVPYKGREPITCLGDNEVEYTIYSKESTFHKQGEKLCVSYILYEKKPVFLFKEFFGSNLIPTDFMYISNKLNIYQIDLADAVYSYHSNLKQIVTFSPKPILVMEKQESFTILSNITMDKKLPELSYFKDYLEFKFNLQHPNIYLQHDVLNFDLKIFFKLYRYPPLPPFKKKQI